MVELSKDRGLASDEVGDTLGSVRIISVSILNKERAKESPDQAIIDKYEKILDVINDLQMEIYSASLERLQEIDDEYVKFLRAHKK